MTTMPVRLRTSVRKRTGGWALAATQIGSALWFAACAWYAIAHNPGLGGWSGLLIGMTAQVGLMTAAMSLIASGWLLVFGYARGHAGLTIALGAGTFAALATIVAIISPAGQSIIGALLD